MEAWTPVEPPGRRRPQRVHADEVLARAGARTGHADPARLPRDPTGTLARRVDSLWRAKIPARIDPAALDIRYEIGPGRRTGPDGVARPVGPRPGPGAVPGPARARTGAPDRGPAVTVLPETPRSLCRHGRWQLVEGGARLLIDLSGLETAGQHRLSLSVRIDAPR